MNNVTVERSSTQQFTSLCRGPTDSQRHGITVRCSRLQTCDKYRGHTATVTPDVGIQQCTCTHAIYPRYLQASTETKFNFKTLSKTLDVEKVDGTAKRLHKDVE
eukprot:6455351-Amphidinium_carterae.1